MSNELTSDLKILRHSTTDLGSSVVICGGPPFLVSRSRDELLIPESGDDTTEAFLLSQHTPPILNIDCLGVRVLVGVSVPAVGSV